jgi:hypothetical protein
VAKVLVQPAGGQAARRHFADTIEGSVPLDRLRRYLPVDDIRGLELLYPSKQVPTWGITPGKNDVNVSTWEQIEPGDVALFVGGGQVFASGRITYKAADAGLAADLWGTDDAGQTWQYLYFLDRIQRHAVPYGEFNQAAGYKRGFIPRGAIVLKEEPSVRVLQMIRPDLLGLARGEQEIPARDGPAVGGQPTTKPARGDREIPAQDEPVADGQPTTKPAAEETTEQAPVEYAAEPAIISDYWTVDDQLGYAAYADAIAEFLQHEDTRPPLTIGIKAPWGAGKTSLMRMVQDRLDPPLDPLASRSGAVVRRRVRLTLVSRSKIADRSGRRKLLAAPLRQLLGIRRLGGKTSPVTNGMILHELQEQAQPPPADHESGPAARSSADQEAPEDRLKVAPVDTAEPGDDQGAWRPTVWFNPWMYQSGEQVWAGLAHELISQLTGRLSRTELEQFWLTLNLRRVDPDAIRRRVHRAVFERVIPLAGGLAALLLFTLATIALRAFVPGAVRLFNLVASAMVGAGSLGVLGAGLWMIGAFFRERADGSLPSLVREPDYVAGWKKLVAQEAKGSFAEVVRDPGYEARLGFLYLVHTDMQRVLEMVATKERPVVVFVDDLDRCSPGTVAQVIEAINLFLAGQFPNCIFVIAMEPEMVAAHVEVAYQALGERLRRSDYWGEAAMLGWRFLDKIVQLPLSVPVLDQDQANRFVKWVLAGRGQPLTPGDGGNSDVAEERVARLEQAIEQQAPSLEEIAEAAARAQAEVLGTDLPAGQLSPEARMASHRVSRRQLRDDSPQFQALVDAVAPWIDRNPRAIKRLVNVIRFYMLIRQGRQEAGLPVPDSVEQIAKLAVLAVQWPQLRSVLGRQLGPDNGATLLALLEAPLDELPPETDWPVRRDALAKKLADSPVPKQLQEDLLAREELCECLANGPPIGAAASGFL